MKHFKRYGKKDVLGITQVRRFETKIGERVLCTPDGMDMEQALQQSACRYVLLGVEEDIGVKANMGVGGTGSLWQPFLASFLNMQSSDFLNGEDVLVLGTFNFDDLKTLIESNAHDAEELLVAYRHAVNLVDEEVSQLIKLVTSARKIPVVVGGGHNNAYPLIKGAAKGLHKAGLTQLAQVNCVNLDAHTDYRPMEGRHSGNSFRYADEDGYLQKYCVVGVHESYIPQNVWIDIVNNPFVDLITFEDIFLHEKRSFRDAVSDAADFTDDTYTGVELDMGSIENVLSSSTTPSGVSHLHARQFVNLLARDAKAAYLHICEGAVELENGRRDHTTGKLAGYLVADFVKAQY
jgi:formiminoglutamase